MSEAERLAVLGSASLLASGISACFSVGGGYVLFGALTWIMPLPAAIAMQSVLSFGSLFSRTHAFWSEIEWPIVRSFTMGSLIGAGAGLWLFLRTSEGLLSLLLAGFLLLLAWAPPLRWQLPQRASFFGVGVLHAITGTLLGMGAVLQPVLVRTQLSRTAIVGTFSTCIILLELLRTAGYASAGFAYRAWWPEILVATVTGLVGTYAGKRLTLAVSERHFRYVLRLFITGLALRLLHKGLA